MTEIPSAPVPLTAEQADAMRQRTLKKHHTAMVLVHWFNAATWFLELTTGAALISSRLYRAAPAWYSELVLGIFGGKANLLRFHVAVGIAWVLVLLPYVLIGLRTYLNVETLHLSDPDDMRWLAVRARRMLGRTDEPLPPQGAYNAGQKAFALVVWTMTPVIAVTGLAMAFQLGSPWAVGWAVVLHFAAAGAVVAGLFVHVYMGAVFPEERPAFFSMITGRVNELFAYRHHFKWWREMKLSELEHDARDAAAAEPAAER